MKARAWCIITIMISLSALLLQGAKLAQAQEPSFHIVSGGTAKYS
jgi:hypothetical protein